MYLLPRHCNKTESESESITSNRSLFPAVSDDSENPKQILTSKCLHFLGHTCRSISVHHIDCTFPIATEGLVEDVSRETSGSLRNQMAKAAKTSYKK